MHSVSAHPVLVHKGCEAEGKALADKHGFGWEFPPAPEWGNPKVQRRPAAPET